MGRTIIGIITLLGVAISFLSYSVIKTTQGIEEIMVLNSLLIKSMSLQNEISIGQGIRINNLEEIIHQRSCTEQRRSDRI
jgi:hypothetical protein